MCGGNDVSFPGPAPQETQLQQMQLDMLNKQNQEINGFTPLLLDQYGYQSSQAANPERQALGDQLNQMQTNPNDYTVTKYNVDGHGTNETKTSAAYDALKAKYESTPQTITQYGKTDARKAQDAQMADLNSQILTLTKSQLQRQQDALDGKLPVSAALKQAKDIEFRQMKEAQGQAGNVIMGDTAENAVAKSTSGQQALEAFNKKYGLLQDEEQRGIIENEANLPSVYESAYKGNQNNTMTGVPNQSYYGMMPMISSAMQPYQFQQQGQFNAASQNSQMANQRLTGMMQLGGQLAGSGMMAGALMA